MNKKGKIYVVGIGPGKKADMTFKAYEAMEKSDIIVGYKTYSREIGRASCRERV